MILFFTHLPGTPSNPASGTLPKRFKLPPIGETERTKVNLRKVDKEPTELAGHIVFGRNNIQKILDDADVEIYTTRISQGNPRTGDAYRQYRRYGIEFIPHS